MKKRASAVRKKMVVVRLNEEEYQKLQSLQQRATDRGLSAYLRKLALQKPVTIKIRNVSADDFLMQMAPLRVALEEACKHYCSATQRLQLMQKIPEFRTWLQLHEASRVKLLHQVEQIETRITQLYEQWLRK